MSSNFPVIPVGARLPNIPRSNDQVLPWASDVSQAIKHLYRSIASALTDSVLAGARGNFSPGSISITTGSYMILTKMLQLTGTNQLVIQGTGQLRIT